MSATREDRYRDLLAAVVEMLHVPTSIYADRQARHDVLSARTATIRGYVGSVLECTDNRDFAAGLRRVVAEYGECSLGRYTHFEPKPLDAEVPDGAHIERHPAHPPRAEG